MKKTCNTLFFTLLALAAIFTLAANMLISCELLDLALKVITMATALTLGALLINIIIYRINK